MKKTIDIPDDQVKDLELEVINKGHRSLKAMLEFKLFGKRKPKKKK